MKELTRVHLAKVPFNIEKDAKDGLKKYLDAVQRSLGDSDTTEDTMHDIELRMVELFAERGIKADGVIAAADVAAVRQQLGEPEQFSDSTESTSDTTEPAEEEAPRRLMRDGDDQILGGVASGLARYFDVDPVIARLSFVLLTFINGFGILLYFILWVILPEAKTSADKLAMQGKPVNVETLKAFGQETGNRLKELDVQTPARQIARVVMGVLSAIAYTAAITLLIAMTVGGVVLYANASANGFPVHSFDWLLVGFVGLILFALSLWFIILGELLQTKKRTSYTAATVIATILFVIGLSGAATVAILNEKDYQQRIEQLDGQLDVQWRDGERVRLQ